MHLPKILVDRKRDMLVFFAAAVGYTMLDIADLPFATGPRRKTDNMLMVFVLSLKKINSLQFVIFYFQLDRRVKFYLFAILTNSL